jgi:hypothetical protein
MVNIEPYNREIFGKLKCNGQTHITQSNNCVNRIL